MILVTGGTGFLGPTLVESLVSTGESVRVLTRRPDRIPRVHGADYVLGDLRAPESLVPAVQGVRVVVSAACGLIGHDGETPESVDMLGNRNLQKAVESSGASIVMMSVVGADPDSPLELARAKWAAEQYLRASGSPWSIVRALPFLETWIEILGASAGRRGGPVVLGRGENPIGFVSVAVVAREITRAVAPTFLVGHVTELGGDPITMNQLAERVRQEQGRTGSVRHVPRIAVRAVAAALRPVKPAVARLASAAYELDTARMTLG
ncbi:SDR family oxidoreductase [Rathayibacter sp. KR2-224]|uniref:SDR family oxidoreductase n=1 Tax=Rathayibacter sp. KR2-224 TaxID=3400913 RepID=UPI003BFD3052